MAVGVVSGNIMLEKPLRQEEETSSVRVLVLNEKGYTTVLDDEEQHEAGDVVTAEPVEFMNNKISSAEGHGLVSECAESFASGEVVVVVIVEPSVAAGAKKKRKRKASEAREKDFDELYMATGETLGRGAFGDVKTFRHVDTKVDYAVKFIQTSLRRSRDKVLKEIEILMRCRSHPNIINISQFFEKPKEMILVFEKLNGGTLMHNAWNQKYLTEEDISQAVKNIANGLYFLHKLGVAHRDLKPDNILCVRPECLVPLKLIDFDLASELMLSSSNGNGIVTTPRLGSPVGSFEFMAPEVVRTWQNTGHHACLYDKRCDLWSLGVILYLLICGYLPFGEVQCGKDCEWYHGKPCADCQNLTFDLIQTGKYSFPDKEWSTISVEAKELVSKLLVRNPWSRFLASDVLHHDWLSEEGVCTRSASVIFPERKPAEQVSVCLASITAISRGTSVVPIDDLSKTLDETMHLDLAICEIESVMDCKQLTVLKNSQEGESERECVLYDKIEEDWCVIELEQTDFHCADEEDDELLFHMSDVEDVGFSDWTHKEDDLDSLPSVLWNVENSRPRPDEDEDSGNGNSTDSGSLFHCASFTLLDA
jgi:MAP kinase interacting serine/threonine kinase